MAAGIDVLKAGQKVKIGFSGSLLESGKCGTRRIDFHVFPMCEIPVALFLEDGETLRRAGGILLLSGNGAELVSLLRKSLPGEFTSEKNKTKRVRRRFLMENLLFGRISAESIKPVTFVREDWQEQFSSTLTSRSPIRIIEKFRI